MALSFGDIALSIGAGVAEKDMAIRDAEFKQSLENFNCLFDLPFAFQ